jgi:Tol biopolymer transport system component
MKSIAKQAVKKILQHSEKTVGLFTVTLLLLTSFFINQNAEAQQLVCPMRAIDQITDDPTEDSDDPSINADGTRIAFTSGANINGGNPDGNREIYLFDTTTWIFTQITDEPSGASGDPSINADGTRIAFQSDADINGGNPDGNREIYLFDTTTWIFTQITDELLDSFFPSINADGTRITFTSTADINGGNPEGNIEIYLFDTTTGIITQITDETAGDSRDPSINADGTRIAFESQANINGGNPDGNGEVYLFDTTTGIITQITDDPAGDSNDPSINADGTRIAFNSNANINGGNPDTDEVYLFDTTTGIITQITDDPTENSGDPSINADGTRIAFESQANINGGNPDGNDEIYLADTTTGIFTQITDETARDSRDPSINADGTRIAFQSDADINGGNPEGNREIYLAACFDPATARNIPALSEWGFIAMAGVLGIVGLFAIRKRRITV